MAGVRSTGIRLPRIAPRYQGRLRILAYHAVLENGHGTPCPSISPAALRRQVKLLRWLGFTFVSLDDWWAYLQQGAPLPPRAVALTFDDGYEEEARVLRELLQQYKIPATMFVVSSLMGDVNRWDLPAGQPLKLMGAEVLRELAPVLRYGSHGRTHAVLSELGPTAVAEELASSKKELEDALQLPVRYVAYPYGEHSPRIGQAARASGYQLGLGVVPGVNDLGSNRFHLRRICLLSHDTLPRFLAKVLFPRCCASLGGARAAVPRVWSAMAGRSRSSRA